MIVYTPPKAADRIPVVDLAGSFASHARRQEAAWEIHKAARETGFFYVAQSAPSCDFGQVGERFGNVAFGIDDGNHRRGQFAPS